MAKGYVVYNPLAGNGQAQADAQLLQFVLNEELEYITPRYTGNNVILKELLDRLTAGYTEQQLQYLEEIFVACSRYEAGFWDMAWNMRK